MARQQRNNPELPTPPADLSISTYTLNASGHKTYRDEYSTLWPENSFSKQVRAELDKLRDKTDKSPGVRQLRKSLPLYRLNGEGKPLSWKELPVSDLRKRRLSASSASSVTTAIKKTPAGPTYAVISATAISPVLLKHEGDNRNLRLYAAEHFDKPAWQIKFTCKPDFRALLDHIFSHMSVTAEKAVGAAQFKHPSPPSCKCDPSKHRYRFYIIGKDTPGKQREYHLCWPEAFTNGTLGLEIGALRRSARGRTHPKIHQLENIQDSSGETRVRNRQVNLDGLITIVSMYNDILAGTPDDSREPCVYTAMQQARKGV